MELPINRPLQMFYGDEIDFNELLDKIKSEKFNGFIRVTSESAEGYILFNEGKQIALSFGDYLKVEAVEKIKSIANDSKTLVETFAVKKSQMDYIIEINKFFIIDSDSGIDELKKTEKVPGTENEAEITPKIDNREEVKKKLSAISGSVTETPESMKDSLEHVNKQESLNILEENESKKIEALNVEKTSRNGGEPEIDESEYQQKNEFIEPKVEDVNREELMKKYGLKDIKGEEVDSILETYKGGSSSWSMRQYDNRRRPLETYKGGSLSDNDIKKIELMLTNKIKKSILGIPKARGTEVMVFLDNNTLKLSGTVKIIAECKTDGLLSRIMGKSRDLENLGMEEKREEEENG